ncbi:ATP synthase F1 subunit delta [Blastopirellula marina]|uniref:ATP synthase subunit delta n=1 Tax=Blastopirellula marina TaxID=124 RepID=A0A2S8FAH5_9BACT|nr:MULTISPECIES: ATP synthase F1 subunit delta [Pirellulaceae]PQO29173.1 ATP synthase F1 subunit delta [Blastopirellula marina]RCS50366.1 ATP synthase F1 subunit delta [Bremerella cremea]
MAGTSSDKQTFDLSRQRIGSVYAKALLGAADDAGQTDVILDEFGSLIHDVIDQREDLRHAIAGSILSEDQRIAVLDKAFSGKMNPVLLTFLKVVTQHERQDCLREIYDAAVKLNNERLGLVEITATTATELSKELSDSLTASLKAKLGREVVLKSEVDPSVIGGLVLHVGDTVFDGSVANRLKQLRQKALETTAQQAKASLERFTNSTQS